MRYSGWLKVTMVLVLAGWLGTDRLWAEEEKEHPKDKPPLLKEKPEKPPVFWEKEKPEKPPLWEKEKPEKPPVWEKQRPGPREKGDWDELDRPFRGEKERPDRPERGPRERQDRPPRPEGKPDYREEGRGPRIPERPDRPDRPDRPPVGPPEGPPRPPMPPRPDWERLQRADPEMFRLLRADEELEEQTHRLAMQYRRAPEAEKEQIRKELTALVTKHFEVRQQRRLLEVRRLEDELRRLRETIERRQAHREEIIQNRLRELLGPDDVLRF